MTPVAASAELRVVAAAEARSQLNHAGPSAPTRICVYVGPFRIPSASAAARAASIAALRLRTQGQACASATPNAGGSAVSRSVDEQRHGSRRRSRRPCTVTSGPSTCSSTSTTPLRDASSAASIAAGELLRGAHERQPALALAVGRLDDARAARSRLRGSSVAAAARRPRRTRSRCRDFDVATSAASRASIGCGRPSRSATRAATPTGQSAPGEMIPSTRSARASRSTPASSSVESDRRACPRSAKPGADGSRSTAITNRSRARGPPRAARSARARRLGRGDADAPEDAPPPGLVLAVPGDRPLEPVLEARSTRASRSAARACRSSRCAGRPGRAARRRGPSSTPRVADRSSTSRRSSRTEMSIPVATFTTSPATRVDRRGDDRLDRRARRRRRRASRGSRARRRGSSAARPRAPA